ncbi:diacylglycerol/lipid kinase family protein [Stakelama tenebrarum]|uniref:DAGKc domain-containing protein n=1 Tax=Stakelama tenebrarum TaxID=2711215 RepID=A0A6G6Y4S2_9SPHN|nr:diacylglycerol kinase family protein [Sphingosinithalassobacter tenebrarum]QIG79603.1 hypothetical protein G5C33_07240 [Sphingosinithalassobacter tenebrarum]
MQRLWFVTNPHSGSATRQKCEAIETVFEERGLTLVGRSGFPDDPIPEAETLDREGVDTLVLFAGDGTINAALCKLANWQGSFLILPGGTMNLLAKALHGERDPHAIIRAAHGSDRRVALPYVEAGPHRAFVGLILGPAAHWFRAREEARRHHPARVLRAIGFAWRKTFGRSGLRVTGVPDAPRGYQAVFVEPFADGIDVRGIDARDWRAIVELGWDWLTGDWVTARAVTSARVQRMGIRGTGKVLALFDGEPVRLDADQAITSGMSAPAFISTREEESA